MCCTGVEDVACTVQSVCVSVYMGTTFAPCQAPWHGVVVWCGGGISVLWWGGCNSLFLFPSYPCMLLWH